MNYVDVTLELLTPAFLSGSDQHRVELRAASIKGLLRWWWRASEGHHYDTHKLAEAEGALFGSAALKLKSPLHLGVELISKQVSAVARGSLGPDSSTMYTFYRKDKEGNVHRGEAQALHYLGYGPIRLPSRQEREAAELGKDQDLRGKDGKAKRGVLYIRPAFAPGTRFRLRLAWRDGTLSADQQDQLFRACGAWVALGGLGCRSRKGFGSLDLVEPVKASSGELVQRASRIIRGALEELVKSGKELPLQLPKWPQVRFRHVLHMTAPKSSWEEALGALALEYRKIRPRKKDRERRFICGEAEPRRASSVLLSVHRNEAKYFGRMVALPCFKDDHGDGRHAWETFLRKEG